MNLDRKTIEAAVLCTVAAWATLHGILHNAPVHLTLLPAWSVGLYFVTPLLAAACVDRPTPKVLAAALLAVLPITLAVSRMSWETGVRAALKLDASPMMLATALGLIGVAAVGWLSDLDPDRWGLGLGDWRWWGPRVGALLVVIGVGCPIAATLFPSLAEFYPMFKPARTDVSMLFAYQLTMAAYLFAWEFLYRGFLLFGLEGRIGAAGAVLVQAWPFYLLHLDKPEPEMVSSWFGGLLMGALCLRARCLWPSFLLHAALYSTMEVTGFFL